MFLMVQGASAWNGSGSSGDPYLIASPADWETFATSTNAYSETFFKLTADITVTTMRTETFSGTFDGGGHTLTFNYTATGNNAAPFAYITGATIKNLRVAGTINTGYKFAAGIAAQTDGTTNITNCQVSVTINSSKSGDGTHGGLVAYQESGTLTINNCLFDGELLGASTSGCGGFVGWVANSSSYHTYISNSLFAPANITVTAYTFCRQKYSTLHLEASTCYYITPASTVQGENAGSMTTASLVTALNNGGTNWCNNGGKATPILIFDYIGNQSNWNAFTSGINAGINYSGKTVKMSADFTATTMVTATFSGTFDGGGHTLTFNYTATGENAAPFAYITGATIKNLRVAGTINTGYKFAAGIVAISNGGTITNCQSSVTINSSKSGDGTHGGLVADSYTGTLNISNCLFDGKLLGTTTTSCGGIVGWHNSNSTLYISNSLFAPAEVTVQGQGGAIIARDGANSLSNSLSNCYYISDWAAATVQGTNANSMAAAALVTALNNGDKNWCVHRGNAIPVMVNLVINNKTEWDNFSSHAGNYENKYVQLNADISNITAMTSGTFKGIFDGNGHTLTVDLSGGGNVAPFQYLNGGTIMNLTVTGTVTGGANYCSGLVARATGGVCLIDNCVVNTNNDGVGFVGGVLAYCDGATSLTISNCIYGGTIAIQPNGNENYSGGIFGWYNRTDLNLTMYNCLFKGNYTGNGQFHPIGVKKWAGAFSSLSCTNCYYTKNPTTPDGPNRFFTDGTKVCELSLGDNIIATGSTCTFDGKTYHLGTVSLSYTPSKSTLFYMIDGNEISGNSFTISKDNQAFDAGAVTITAGDTSITYHYGGTNNNTLYIDGNSNMVTHPWTSEANYSSITSVVIGNGVTSICGNAFKQCPNLTSASIASTVTSIDNSAFNSCTNLTSVTCWPTTPPTLGTSVFPSTTNIYVPSVNDYKDVGNWSSYYSANIYSNKLYPISWEVNTNQIASGSFAGYWATFYYSGANMLAPEGVTVYKATRSDSSLSLTEISDRIITAGKAVILKKETAGSINLSVAGGESAGDYSDNSLQGVDKATARETAFEYKYYTLANGSKGLGFYKYTGATLAANKAYIMTVTSNASEYIFSLDGETTGVNDVRSKKDDVRGDYYNLNGQKVPNPTKGLYIVNGKKVIK